jgi:hypothetical protein
VVVVGYSGGLHAALSPGTLLLPDRLLGPKGVVRTGAASLARAAKILPQAKVGPAITVDRVAAPWDKAALGVDALGVDLESALLGEDLFRQGIPFLVVRIVLDALWESIPTGWKRGAWAGRGLACSWRLGQAARLLRPALAAYGGNLGGADPRCSPPNPDGKSSLPPRAPSTRREPVRKLKRDLRFVENLVQSTSARSARSEVKAVSSRRTQFTAEAAEIAEKTRFWAYGFNPQSASRMFSASSARSAVNRPSTAGIRSAPRGRRPRGLFTHGLRGAA